MDYEDDFTWREFDDPQEHQEHQNLLVVMTMT